jgi:hypothetical protein
MESALAQSQVRRKMIRVVVRGSLILGEMLLHRVLVLPFPPHQTLGIVKLVWGHEPMAITRIMDRPRDGSQNLHRQFLK